MPRAHSTTNKISRRLLEVFPNPYPGRDYEIVHENPEFTSVCPKTGLPDFGTITVLYIPAEFCVELKSLKLYFMQFRNYGAFYESVTNMILDDLVHVMRPKRMEVVGEFTTRGGMHSVIRATHEAQEKKRR
jgi:7-cyano-7-deazaguanine reductase